MRSSVAAGTRVLSSLLGVVSVAWTTGAGAQPPTGSGYSGYGAPAPAAPTEPQVTYTPMQRPGAPPPAPPAPYAPPMRPSPALAVPAPRPVAPAPAMGTSLPTPSYQLAPPLSPSSRPPAGTMTADAGLAASRLTTDRAPRRSLGLGLDVGLPDGLYLGLVLAPAQWVRLQAALGTNSASLAYRGGLTFVPVGFGPSFSFEAGHCNLAATNEIVRTFFSVPAWVQAYVQQLGYTYFNAHIGYDLVLGNATLFLHGGYTFLIATVHAPDPVYDKNSGTTIRILQDGTAYAQTLSAKLGLIYLFGGA